MKEKVIFKKFNGTGELSNYLSRAIYTDTFKNSYTFKNHGSQTKTKEYEKWSKTSSYEEAEKLLLYGCKDLQKRIEAAGVSKLRLRLNQFQNKRQIFSGVTGFAPNVPAYLTGTPNSMINVRMVKVRQRVVNFMFNTSVACTVPSDDIVNAVAKVVQAIMIVEASGVRVNVWAGCALMDDESPDCLWLCKIKDSGQRMDTLKMAYPIAHPSMFRRQWFKLLETTDGVPRGYTDGYGKIIKTEDRCFETLKNAGVNNIHRVLSFYDVKSRTPEEIAKMITVGGK